MEAPGSRRPTDLTMDLAGHSAVGDFGVGFPKPFVGPQSLSSHSLAWLLTGAMCTRRKCIYKSISPRRWFHLLLDAFWQLLLVFLVSSEFEIRFPLYFRQDSKCELDGAIPTTDLPYFLAQCLSLQP